MLKNKLGVFFFNIEDSPFFFFFCYRSGGRFFSFCNHVDNYAALARYLCAGVWYCILW